MKGVILAAGYGTRFLPITRCVPKEMLPVGTRPALDLVVEELREAGVSEILIVTARRKKVLDDWFDRDAELDAVFEAEGAAAKASLALPPAVNACFVRQQHMGGTGHALALARPFVGNAPFVVAYPDDLFTSGNPTAQLVEAWERTGCSVLAVADHQGRDVSRYGVVDAVEPPDGVLRVRGIVEKPPPGTEPSKLVSLGRYLYTSEVLSGVEAGLAAHAKGEYWPMDALNAAAARGGLAAVVVAARHHDTGSPQGWLRTVVELALEDPDEGPALEAWLRSYLG